MSLESIMIIHPDEINTGIDWSQIFPNDYPLKLEIGFGIGDFLVHQAWQDPESNFVGIERLKKYVYKAKKKADFNELVNLCLIHGEVISIISKIFGKKKLREVYINFPDPWPKRRHRFRRLIQPLFLDKLSDALEDKGLVNLATDVPDYAWQMFHCFQNHNSFENLFLEKPFVYSIEGRFPTKYERDYQSQGKTIYYLLFRKVG